MIEFDPGPSGRSYWLDQIRKPGFLTEAVAAVQMAATQQHTKLNAEPWQIARAIGQLMEK